MGIGDTQGADLRWRFPLFNGKHTALRRDHARSRQHPHALDAQIEQYLTDLVRPATYAVADQYRRLGLRERVLTLPIMVALVTTLIWRQVPAVSELVRLLARDRLLWSPPVRVSQQAFSLRLRSLPASLFAAVVHDLLPTLQARAAARARPVAPVVARAQRHFAHIWIADATQLEVLFKKVGLLRGQGAVLRGGILLGLLDLPSRLPVHLLWDPETDRNERTMFDQIADRIPRQTLVLLDGGFSGFARFDWCTEHEVAFITRPSATQAYRVVEILQETEELRDRIIALGQYRSNPCRHPVRLIERRTAQGWHRVITNVLDPALLPAPDVLTLYAERWRIEEAYALVKRLLGLSYLWTGAANGIELQIWATWLLYAVLIDLCDQIAERKGLPLARISVEMVYRGLYHFAGAVERGEATDPVAYLATQDDLGIVKRLRTRSAPLDEHGQSLNL